LDAAEKWTIELTSSNSEAAKRIFAIEEDFRSAESKGFGKDLIDDVKNVWSDPAIQQTYVRRSEFQLNDSAEYFFSNIDRITLENYIPTVPDILQVRTKTTGINEIEFAIGKYKFSMTDVGGQRSERRKWIHCFENVTAIIFCAALSEYDQKLYEDQTTNRMWEALKLFSDITNSRWFNDTPIILFLNKKDLFEKKILKVPLSVCFNKYTGPNTAKEASEYIEQQFLAQVKNKEKLIYTYQTCATDTNNVKFIFKAVKDVFITAYLNHLGIGLGTGTAPPPKASRTGSGTTSVKVHPSAQNTPTTEHRSTKPGKQEITI